jgi:MraZ protein
MLSHAIPGQGFARPCGTRTGQAANAGRDDRRRGMRQTKGAPGRMTHFMGTHHNRLDAKGRVSIPASFRTALRDGDAPASLVLRPSHKHRCIEGWPPAMFAALSAPLQAFDVFSEDQDDLALAVFADAWPMEADKEGRIVLPENLKAHAGLVDSVVFMGLGTTFQIWEPKAAEERRAAALLRARGLTLPGGKA